ncbi:jg26573, partial [Pararge aegeria aegeria]
LIEPLGFDDLVSEGRRRQPMGASCKNSDLGLGERFGLSGTHSHSHVDVKDRGPYRR